MGKEEVLRLAEFGLICLLLVQCQLTEGAGIVTLDLTNEKERHADISNRNLLRERRSSGVDDAVCFKQEMTLLKTLGSKNISDQHKFLNVSTYEYSRLSLIWAGDNNKAEVLLAVAYSQYYWYDDISQVFRSDNDGRSFTNITDKVLIKIESSYGIQNNPYNPKQVYIMGKKAKKSDQVVIPGANKDTLCLTEDGGLTFTHYILPFVVDSSFIFHTSEDCSECFMLLAEDKNLYVTWNNGRKWSNIGEDVDRARWGYDPRQDDKKRQTTLKTIFMETISGTREVVNDDDYSFFTDGQHMTFHNLWKSTDGGANFNLTLANVIGFGEMNGFLYASVFEDENDTSNVKRLLKVNHRNGDPDYWFDCEVPTIMPDQFYSVLYMDEGIIFLHVDSKGESNHGTLYTSAVNGTVFFESLQRHLYSDKTGVTDFYKVRSLRGVYITSQVSSEDGSIHSMISYNRGATWQKIPAPSGVPCVEGSEECYLQLYMNYMKSEGFHGEMPLSEESAPGIILAHGHVADSVQQHYPDVFVSSDGGYSWNLALEGPHQYVIGDSGGLLTAISTNRSWDPLQTVKFSTDEGRCWHAYNFTNPNSSFTASGIFSEPGGKSMKVSIWGKERDPGRYYGYNWQCNVVLFQEALSQKCAPSDYETWMAHSQHRANEKKDVQGCLLGIREVFMRLKKDSWCYNGHEFQEKLNITYCNCTREDYDCDYGYMRQDNSDKCVRDFKAKEIHICLHGHNMDIVSEGYMKIPGDKCQGGFHPNATKMIDVKKTCKDYSNSLVMKDLGPAISKSDSGSGKSTGSKLTKNHKIAIIVIVAVVLVLAIVVSAFAVKKTCMARKKREQRYTLLNHTDEDEFPDDDDQASGQPSHLTIRTESDRNNDDRMLDVGPGKEQGRGNQTSNGYHDDSDDDMLMQ